jgi:hypothetical protein
VLVNPDHMLVGMYEIHALFKITLQCAHVTVRVRRPEGRTPVKETGFGALVVFDFELGFGASSAFRFQRYWLPPAS